MTYVAWNGSRWKQSNAKGLTFGCRILRNVNWACRSRLPPLISPSRPLGPNIPKLKSPTHIQPIHYDIRFVFIGWGIDDWWEMQAELNVLDEYANGHTQLIFVCQVPIPPWRLGVAHCCCTCMRSLFCHPFFFGASLGMVIRPNPPTPSAACGGTYRENSK